VISKKCAIYGTFFADVRLENLKFIAFDLKLKTVAETSLALSAGEQTETVSFVILLTSSTISK